MSGQTKRHPFYYLGFAIWMCAFCILFAGDVPILAGQSGKLLALAFAVLAIYLIWKFAPSDTEQSQSAGDLTGAAGVLAIVLGTPLVIAVAIWLVLLAL